MRYPFERSIFFFYGLTWGNPLLRDRRILRERTNWMIRSFTLFCCLLVVPASFIRAAAFFDARGFIQEAEAVSPLSPEIMKEWMWPQVFEEILLITQVYGLVFIFGFFALDVLVRTFRFLLSRRGVSDDILALPTSDHQIFFAQYDLPIVRKGLLLLALAFLFFMPAREVELLHWDYAGTKAPEHFIPLYFWNLERACPENVILFLLASGSLAFLLFLHRLAQFLVSYQEKRRAPYRRFRFLVLAFVGFVVFQYCATILHSPLFLLLSILASQACLFGTMFLVPLEVGVPRE